MTELVVQPTGGEAVVSANVGDTVEVRIPDNPTTGYRWEVASVDANLVVEHERWDTPEHSIGAGGHRAITVRVVGAGTSTLDLRCWRPWAGETSIIERASIVITA